MRKYLIALLGLAVIGVAGYAWAQGFPGYISTIQGNELVTVQEVQPNGQQSPLVNIVTTSQLRNSTGYQLLASASGTNNFTNIVNDVLVNAQPAASTTFNTPASPYDGELFAVCNVTNAAWATNTVTLAATSGSTLNTGTTTALTTLAAHTCEELQFDVATTTWYQIR